MPEDKPLIGEDTVLSLYSGYEVCILVAVFDLQLAKIFG